MAEDSSDCPDSLALLDLTESGSIHSDYIEAYNAIALELQDEFNDWVGQLAPKRRSLNWLFSGPASRNVLLSPLFEKICGIQLALQISKKFPKLQVKVEVASMAILLKQQGISVLFEPRPWSKKFKQKAIKAYVTFILFLQKRAANQSFGKKDQIPQGITLIDTFVLSGFLNKDRYYPGLLDLISEEQKRQIRFLPNFLGWKSKELKGVFSELRQREGYLFKEDYLKYSDYFKAVWKAYRMKSCAFKNVPFRGLDLKNLIRDDLKDSRHFSSSVVAWLHYFLPKRLKKEGVEINVLIDWYENQPIDKGLHAGFHQYYPEVYRKGYQGMLVSDLYLHKYPTQSEANADLCPHEVDVMGESLCQDLSKYAKNIKFVTSPSFRFQGVFKPYPPLRETAKKCLLVALPIMREDSVDILKTVTGIEESLKGIGIDLMIKCHPTANESILRKCGAPWPKMAREPLQNFEDCMHEAHYLLSAASSTCVEALAMGRPVIVMGNPKGLTWNPIPKGVNKDWWSICNTSREVQLVLQQWTEVPPNSNEMSNHIRSQYFTPVTTETIERFLKRN